VRVAIVFGGLGLLLAGCHAPQSLDGGSALAACEAHPDESACTSDVRCYAVFGRVISRDTGEGRCWDHAATGGDEVYANCLAHPMAGTLLVEHRIDPESGHCLHFPSGSQARREWSRCEDVMPACR